MFRSVIVFTHSKFAFVYGWVGSWNKILFRESLFLLYVVLYLSDLFSLSLWMTDFGAMCRWLFTQTGYRCWCRETTSLRSLLIQRLCLVHLNTSHSLSIIIAHQGIPPTQTPFKNVEDSLFISITIGVLNIWATNHIELSWVWHRMFCFLVLFFFSPHYFATLIGFGEIIYAYFVYIALGSKTGLSVYSRFDLCFYSFSVIR